nr:EOG090X0EJQ [Lepidurus arcticus]
MPKLHHIEYGNMSLADCQEQESLSKAEPAFYRDAASYWSQVPATVDGVLGGYGHVSSVDVQGSERFLRAISQRPERLLKERALDCGAGVGRVTKEFLKDHFKIVDLVEQDFHFLEAAKTDLSATGHKGRFFCQGLQNFQPEEGYYDVIWSQWVLGHLIDADLVKFFERCKIGLRPKGYLVIKENVTASGEVEMDHTDSSVTRPLKSLIDLVKKAGYQLVHQQKQQRFPKDLYQVYMLAFKPNKP